MAKYRILKRTTLNSNLTYNTNYIIQKRILFWYCNVYKNRVIHTGHNDTCKIYRTSAMFAYKQDALDYLEVLKHPFKFKHRGYKIIKEDKLFINVDFYANNYLRYYYCSFSLADLQRSMNIIIDKPKDKYIY